MTKTKNILFLLLLVVAVSACSLPAFETSQTIPQTTATIAPELTNPIASIPTITFADSTLPVGMPTVETDFNNTLSSLQSGNFSYIASLVHESYDASAYSTPGTLTYTAKFASNETLYLNYGWCATDSSTLQQNLQHINVSFYFNGQQIPAEYVTTITSQPDNMECANAGMLLSGWQPGNYQFRVVATFDGTVNDGLSDYTAGDYISEYQITVQ